MSTKDFDYRQGWSINPDAPADSSEAKQPYVDNGTDLILPERYYSAEWAKQEFEKIWSQIWTMAGFESELEDVGDYFTYELGPESFVIVRTDSGIRAFYNVCPHRGNRVVLEKSGAVVDGFVCTFHSWKFGLDGAVQKVTDEETFRKEALCGLKGLEEVRCETWQGLVFISMNPSVESLENYLANITDHIDPFMLRDMKPVRWVSTRWPVNWKVALDVFMETYHVHGIHHEVMPFLNEYNVQLDCFENGMSRMLLRFGEPSPRNEDREELTDALKVTLQEGGIDPETFEGTAMDVRDAVRKAKLERATITQLDYSRYVPNQMTDDWNYNIFPNITVNLHPEGALIQRLRPVPGEPESCIYEMITLIHPVDDPTYRLPQYIDPDGSIDCRSTADIEYLTVNDGESGMGLITDQDREILGKVQAGVKSKAFQGARLSEQELRLRHFHAEIDRLMAVAAAS